MNAKDRLDTGDLAGAAAELNQALRARPTDTHLRLSLFEVLCFLGDYERAGKQLGVLVTQAPDPANQFALHVYEQLLAAETRRRQVFAGKALPKFLLTPPPATERYAVLLARLAAGEDCADQFAEAEEATPSVAGSLDSGAFAHIRDADDRIAPVLEVFHGSEYLWIPFEQIASLKVAQPASLRDLLWAPAVLEVAGQPAGDVFIPTLYVNSHSHPDGQVKLGRLTEWTAINDRIVTGAGQRVLLAGDAEQALLSIRELRIDHPAPAPVSS